MAYCEMFAVIANVAANPITNIRSFRMTGRVLGDLGQFELAQKQTELALRASRELKTPASLNAYDIDDAIASRCLHARVLWLRGFPDDAKKEADKCLSEALLLGHEQSTCWAIAFGVCPIAIWRGDFAEARHTAGLLMSHSQKAFEHWHDWGLLYDKFLHQMTSDPDERDEFWFESLRPTLPSQIDLLGTFDTNLAGHTALVRAQADEEVWCAAEILRAWTEHHFTQDSTVLSQSKAALEHSVEIARRQGAKAWELRAATSLASLMRDTGQVGKSREALQSVLDHFTQGRSTRDVAAASALLSQL